MTQVHTVGHSAGFFSAWHALKISSANKMIWCYCMILFSNLFRIDESALQFTSLSSGARQILSTNISQGSVRTRLKCGGIFNYRFIRNLLLSPLVKEFWKSIDIWHRLVRCKSRVLFQDTVTFSLRPVYSRSLHCIGLCSTCVMHRENTAIWRISLKLLKSGSVDN